MYLKVNDQILVLDIGGCTTDISIITLIKEDKLFKFKINETVISNGYRCGSVNVIKNIERFLLELFKYLGHENIEYEYNNVWQDKITKINEAICKTKYK